MTNALALGGDTVTLPQPKQPAFSIIRRVDKLRWQRTQEPTLLTMYQYQV